MRQSSAVCVLYTQDPELHQQVEAYSVDSMRVRQVESVERLDSLLNQLSHCILIVDLRLEGALSCCGNVIANRDDIAVISLGVPRSEPMLEAERHGVYATEETPLVRTRFQALMKRAQRFLQLQVENEGLKEQIKQQN